MSKLDEQKNIKLNLNEAAQSLEFHDDKIELKTNKSKEKFDLVVSSIYSRCMFQLISIRLFCIQNLSF